MGRPSLDVACNHSFFRKPVAKFLFVIEEGIDRGIGIHVCEDAQHLLGTTLHCEELMDECYFHCQYHTLISAILSSMPDRMESFLEDRSYYFTLQEDARLLRQSAERKGDMEVEARLEAFLLRLRAIASVTLAYWRHGQSGKRADIAWAMGFGEEEEELDSFLVEFGFTDDDLHQKSLSELVHMDRVTGDLARHIETSRENYRTFLRGLISCHSFRSMP